MRQYNYFSKKKEKVNTPTDKKIKKNAEKCFFDAGAVHFTEFSRFFDFFLNCPIAGRTPPERAAAKAQVADFLRPGGGKTAFAVIHYQAMKKFLYMTGLLSLALALAAAPDAGTWQSRYGFGAVLPDGWKAGLDALDEPAWGELDQAGRAALAAELAPDDREIIMTGPPVSGFNHLSVTGEEAVLFTESDRPSIEARFASYFKTVPDAVLTVRETAPAGIWAEVRVAFEDGTVLIYVYWQVEPERLVVMSLFGAAGPQGRLLADWEQFVTSITMPKEADNGGAVTGDNLQEP